MKPLSLKKEKRGQFVPTVGTDILGAILRIIGYYIKKAERNIVRTGTHNGEPNKENTVNKKVSTLKAGNSARHQKKNFRDEN
jgi:hypothetical protein